MKMYVRPEMKVVSIETSSTLLAGSGTKQGDDYYNEYTGAEALSPKTGFKSLWDED